MIEEISIKDGYELVKDNLMQVLNDLDMLIGGMGGGSEELHIARTKIQESIFWTIAHESHNN